MVSANRKKAVNKRILFLIGRNSDSNSQNKGFVKKIRFYYAGKLVLPAGVFKNIRKNDFQ